MGCISSQQMKYSPPQLQKYKLLIEKNYSNDNNAYFFIQVQKLLKEQKPQTSIFSHQLWMYLLTKFKKFYLDYQEKIQFLDLIEKLIKKNMATQKRDNKFDYIREYGAKLHKLQNTLYFKHKQAIEYLKFMPSKQEHPQLSGQFLFSDLKFDLSKKQTLQVAAKVRTLCQKDLNAFAFLSLYLQVSVTKRLETQKLQSVQSQYLNLLNLLQKQYPAASNNIGNDFQQMDIKLSHKNLSKTEMQEKFDMIYFNEKQDHFEKLKSLILQKSQRAKEDEKHFLQIVKYICYEKGYGFKYNLKIKSAKNQASIFRTIEKLVEDDLQELSKNANNQRVVQTIMEMNKFYQIKQLTEMIHNEIQEVNKKVKSIIQSKSSIRLMAKDLLRGKATFDKFEDIISTAQKLISNIKSKNDSSIIEVKNSLKRTNTIFEILKVKESVAQLQLVLKLDSISNEFNHKIYELKRSKLYSPITNLFVHNKKWCQELFGQLFQLVQNVEDLSKSIEVNNQAFKMQFIKDDVTKFVQKFFRTNQIDLQNKKQQQAINEKIYVIKKIEEIKSLISLQKQKQIQQKLYKAKLNEILFLKQLFDYEKVIEKYELWKVKEENQAEEEDKSLIIDQIGRVYDNQGNYAKALQFYERCWQIQNKIKGKDSIDVSVILNNIGSMYWKQGNYAKALQFYKRCLQIQNKIKGKDSIDVAGTLNNIGSVYNSQGNYAKTLQFYEKCLQIQTKIKGKDSIDAAGTLNNIGLVYKNQGNYAKALQFYERSLQIRTKIKGKESIDVAQSLNNIGSVYDDQRNYAKALQFYERCLQIQTKIKGKDSIDVAVTLNNIGLVYDNQGNYANALQFYERSLQIRTKIKGKDSIDVAVTLNNIGSLYWNQGNYPKALQFYERCLQIRTKIKGKDSIDVADTSNNIGLVYDNQGNYAKALQFYERSLQIRIKIKGKDSIDVAESFNNIAVTYFKLQQFNKALNFMQYSFKIRQSKLGANHHLTIQSFDSLNIIKQCLSTAKTN